jgi:hypothetical protein
MQVTLALGSLMTIDSLETAGSLMMGNTGHMQAASVDADRAYT